MVLLHTKQQGSTIVEVLIALTVVSLVLVTSIAGLTLVTRNRRFSMEQSLSTKYNQEALEWLRRQRDTLGWLAFYNALKTTSGGTRYVTYCLPSTLSSSVTLANICSVGQCYGSVGSCSNNFLLQGETVTRYLTLDLVNLTQADQMQATARIQWTDGGKTHQSEAILKLRKWQ